jgi:hypothetical protein
MINSFLYFRPGLDEAQEEHAIRAYKLISNAIPSFKSRIEEFTDSPDSREFGQTLQTGTYRFVCIYAHISQYILETR